MLFPVSNTFSMELVDGKYDTRQGPAKPHTDIGNMVGLVLQLTKYSINTAIPVFMDNGFCILKAIIEINKITIFRSALVKNIRYWHKYNKGGYIKDNFRGGESWINQFIKGKNVGE